MTKVGWPLSFSSFRLDRELVQVRGRQFLLMQQLQAINLYFQIIPGNILRSCKYSLTGSKCYWWTMVKNLILQIQNNSFNKPQPKSCSWSFLSALICLGRHLYLNFCHTLWSCISTIPSSRDVLKHCSFVLLLDIGSFLFVCSNCSKFCDHQSVLLHPLLWLP